uniref:US12 prolyl 3-hydroxylase n=1 Tax=Rhabditophanes sp. KR3021 TaxID=114890 RepID=A0AC35U9V1_9BILA
MFQINRRWDEKSEQIGTKRTPFLWQFCPDFIASPESLKLLRKELRDKVKFRNKSNDLYNLDQTTDLQTVQKIKKLPVLGQFLKFMQTSVREWVIKQTGFDLTDQLSITGSRYSKGDYLLPHDDRNSNRKVAFVLYLNDMTAEDGGSLRLFGTDGNNFPDGVIEEKSPHFNDLCFFEVSEKSWHEVKEVLGKAKRWSVNGWFHVKEQIDLKRVAVKTLPISLNEETFDFEDYLSPDCLNDKLMAGRRREFEKNSYIAINNFLKPDVLEKVKQGLKQSEYSVEGPWHKYKQFVRSGDIKNGNSITAHLTNFFQSKQLMTYFSVITGLHFVDIPGIVTSLETAEDDHDLPGPSKKARMENQDCGKKKSSTTFKAFKMSQGCYKLADDQVLDTTIDQGYSLDVKFFITDDQWKDKDGGYTSYIAAFEKSEILRLKPVDNVAYITFKEPKCLDITRYIGSAAGEKEYSCFNVCYHGIDPPVGDDSEDEE